jgi:hypothetical protein
MPKKGENPAPVPPPLAGLPLQTHTHTHTHTKKREKDEILAAFFYLVQHVNVKVHNPWTTKRKHVCLDS